VSEETNPQRIAQAVVMGASAGAVEALTAILPKLSRTFPLPIMVVVHLPADKKSFMAELFRAKCPITVREADDKEPIEKGTVYFAPPDYHLLVETNHSLSLSSEEPVLYSRPSIDLLFETAADAYGKGLLGVILTGANSDGAKGLKAVVKAGGTAIVQEPQGASSPTMPKAALQACPDALVMSLEQIANYLQEVTANA